MRRVAKACLRVLATVIVLPAYVVYSITRFGVGEARAFPGWSQAFSLLPGLSGAYLRRAFYRLVLPECGDGTWLTFGTLISHSTARLGRNVYVGAYCILGDVTLEDDVLVGSHVSIINGARQHCIERLDLPVREQPGVFPRITIGMDSWIGERAIVMADVGAHAVVAAGAVVTKPVGDYQIVAGVPAAVISDRRQAASVRTSPRDSKSAEMASTQSGA